MRAWVWDWLNGEWKTAERRDLIPGRTVLAAAECGGYDPETGWDPDRREPVSPVPLPEPTRSEIADADPDSDALSMFAWQTIAVHGRKTGRIAQGIAETLIPDRAYLFGLCGRWHDLGKAHPAFQGCIVGENRPDRPDIAKAEQGAWLPRRRLYPMAGETRRAGFRHELVSVIGLFEALRGTNPDHPALLGPWRELLTAAGFDPPEKADPTPDPSVLESELAELSPDDFNLLAYLVCAHHGKIRLAWHATPADQAANDENLRIAGVKDGDFIPAIPLADAEGEFRETGEFVVDLSAAAAGLNGHTGMGWTERVLKLMEARGPFVLAWMEAMFRAADQRASRMEIRDELLHPEETS
jgi:CRISPR-associated endonuclease/helicase Cas3